MKKSRLLSKIAAESRKHKFDSNTILNRTINNLVEGKTVDKRELYIEQLLTLLASDSYTINLLATSGHTFDDIRKIISRLELTGAGQLIKGHYVAVSSIAFLSHLRIILEHWDGKNFKIENLDSHNSNLKIADYLLQSFK